MSYTYLLESGEESSADTFSDIPQFVLLRLNLTADESYSSGNETESCQNSQSGMMSAHSTEPLGEEKLMSFAGDSRARTFQLLEEEKESRETEVVYGKRCIESFAKFDPIMHSWKTHQCSLLGGWELFSEIWPQWGIMQNGECWEPTIFLPHILESEFGLLVNTGGGGQNLAHADSLYEQGISYQCPNQKEWQKQGEGSSRPCCPSYDGVSYTPSKRSQRQRPPWFSFDPAEIGEGKANQPINDSIKETWGIESRVGRVAHGIPSRVDRLKALGNAQVPIVAATAFNILTKQNHE
jgi:hypothetical protein